LRQCAREYGTSNVARTERTSHIGNHDSLNWVALKLTALHGNGTPEVLSKNGGNNAGVEMEEVDETEDYDTCDRGQQLGVIHALVAREPGPVLWTRS
jgi:hypothetical protein